MPKPTQKAVAKSPQAVLIVAFKRDDLTTIFDRDFEAFEAGEDLDPFIAECVTTAEADLAAHGNDLVHVLVKIADTGTMDITAIKVVGLDDVPAGLTGVEALLRNDPTLLFEPEVPRKTATKAAAKASPVKVKARKRGAAADVAKGAAADDGNAPKPKARPRKAVAVPAGPNADAAAAVPAANGAAALKKRLAAKKAAPKVDDPAIQVDASEDAPANEMAVPVMGFAIEFVPARAFVRRCNVSSAVYEGPGKKARRADGRYARVVTA